MSAPPPLTWLYVPADRPERVPKALASGADAVIVDLEDAVAPARKEEARAGLEALLGPQTDVRVFLRVNAADTPWHADDLGASARLPLAGVIVPKVESADAVPQLGVPVNCLIETPLGIERAFEIASAPGVGGLSLGEADLRARTGASGSGLDWARSRVVNAAVAAGLPRPPQSVYLGVKDLDGLAESCRRGRELGFFGRTAIHPQQLPVIEAAWLPTEEEVLRAREVVAAARDHAGGGFAAGGDFVDAPVVAAAEQVLALAERRRSA